VSVQRIENGNAITAALSSGIGRHQRRNIAAARTGSTTFHPAHHSFGHGNRFSLEWTAPAIKPRIDLPESIHELLINEIAILLRTRRPASGWTIAELQHALGASHSRVQERSSRCAILAMNCQLQRRRISYREGPRSHD
jgi:hypothetical protein